MIKTKIVADSINPSGCRITTFLWTYPRIIHAELMTHRAFSRNAASSRATPFPKMLASIEQEPAMPSFWGEEQKGMVTGAQIADIAKAEQFWLQLKCVAVDTAERLAELGLHKSICNRVLETFAHMTVLVTATDRGLTNFFALRAHEAADKTFQALAYPALDQYLASTPEILQWGEWHMPGIEYPAAEGFTQDELLKIATALAARTSFTAFEDGLDHQKAYEIHDVKLQGPPIHGSPFEHCALASREDYPLSNFDVGYAEQWIRCGWHQYRKMVEGEATFETDLYRIAATKPDWIK